MSTRTVWSYGGGKQTAAIAALIVRGELPKPDLVVMADTGRERSSTWRYLRGVIEPALKSIGLDVYVAPHSLATVDLWSKGDDQRGKLLIPAFTTKSGKLGKLPTYCSNEWKRRVIMRWLKANRFDDVELWLGISRDEADRMKDSDVQWMSHRYPLIDLMMNRQDCIRIVREMGWPDAPKSTCFICPHLSDSTWLEMQQEDPEDFCKAVATEQAIQRIDPNIYLHRSGQRLDEVDFRYGLSGMFDGCDSGMCWV